MYALKQVKLCTVLSFIIWPLCIADDCKFETTKADCENAYCNNLKYPTLIIDKDCCIVNKHRVVQRMEYVLKLDILKFWKYIPVLTTESARNNTDVIEHYLVSEVSEDIMHQHIEFKKINDSYLACLRGKQLTKKLFHWESVTYIRSSCEAHHDFLNKLNLTENLKILEICEPLLPSTDLYLENLQELLISRSNITDMKLHAPRLQKVTLHKTASISNIYFSEETQQSIQELNLYYTNNVEELLKNLTSTSLIVLNMTGSPVKLDSGVFSSNDTNFLSSIKTLDMSFCHIKTFYSENDFAVLTSLENLNLTGNRITIVPSDIFFHMQLLKTLNMANSSVLENLTLNFNTHKTLDFVDLSKNNFAVININFSSEVNHLDMSQNRLTYESIALNCNSFPCINNMNLSKNGIEVNAELFNNLNAVKLMDIGEYKLHCTDCRVLQSKPMKKIHAREFETKILNFGKDELKCTEPTRFNGTMFSGININELCPADQTLVTIIVPIAVLIIISVMMLIFMYKYRFELSYWVQYVKLKRRKLAICACVQTGYTYDAFVSYCGHDRRWIWTDLRPALENGDEKYRLCLHERDFLLGSAISENISNSMANSRYCIMVLSNYFIESQWCRWEMELANFKLVHEEREFLILVEIEPLDTAKIPSHLKNLIKTRTYLEWNLKKFPKEKLMDRLKKALGKSIYERNLEVKSKDVSDTKI